MKNKSIKLLLTTFSALLFTIINSSATNYYFSSTRGAENLNKSSVKKPFRSFEKLKNVKLWGGDTIFLERGSIFNGEIFIANVAASAKKPLVVMPYGDKAANAPLINAAGCLAGVRIYNSSGVWVEGIDITADGSGGGKDWTARNEKINLSKTGTRCGIYYKTNKAGDFSNITIKDVSISGVFLNEKGFVRGAKDVNSANGTGGYGFGMLFYTFAPESSLSNVLIEDCKVENVAHTGIRFVGKAKPYTIKNAQVISTKVIRAGGPGIQMSGVDEGVLRYCTVDNSGSDDDSRKWKRGTGYWCFASQNILVEHSTFMNANGPADSSGTHIDYNCNNVVYQYNLSKNNAGGFVEILGENYNCIYRYNVSINDGHRINGDTSGSAQEVAHQWGYSIWISNWSKTKKGPYNSYIYNNTIYVSKANVSRNTFAETLEGIYIANNIFHVEGDAQAIKKSWSGHFDEKPKKGVINFKNNLFLSSSSWAEDSTISDIAPLFGDAEFKNKSGKQISDFTPQNKQVVKNKGIEIEPLPETKIPLRIDLKVQKDILGNTIEGRPDMGAIEMK